MNHYVFTDVNVVLTRMPRPGSLCFFLKAILNCSNCFNLKVSLLLLLLLLLLLFLLLASFYCSSFPVTWNGNSWPSGTPEWSRSHENDAIGWARCVQALCVFWLVPFNTELVFAGTWKLSWRTGQVWTHCHLTDTLLRGPCRMVSISDTYKNLIFPLSRPGIISRIQNELSEEDVITPWWHHLKLVIN